MRVGGDCSKEFQCVFSFRVGLLVWLQWPQRTWPGLQIAKMSFENKLTRRLARSKLRW